MTHAVKPVTPKILNHCNGRFVLSRTLSTNQRALLAHSSHWEKLGPDIYATTHLGAAKAFRKYGDERVEKIFTKTFQSHYVLPKLKPLPGLDPHQRKGIQWILSRKRSYLAHAPGAGKTAQAILAAALAKGAGQSIFVVPPHLTRNWEREILKFTEWLDLFPTIGIISAETLKTGRVAWNADYIIIADSFISRRYLQFRLTRPKKFLAVDEASRFKEPFTQRSLALYGGKDGDVEYRGIFQNARHVVFMDGSPMPNRPIELWAPTFALHPEAIDCMTYDEFGYYYCGAKPNERGVWEYLYSSNEEELKTKLQNDFMHVVTESELSHPERKRSMLFMEDVRSREHKEWERRHLGKFERHGTADESMSQGEAAKYRRELGVRKVPWVVRYVSEKLRYSSDKILLFAWHREVCKSLYRELGEWDPGLIMGGVSQGLREKSCERFQLGTSRLLILNIAAGGRGINLQSATRVIFAEFSWTDETNRQCEKRASRKGSTRNQVRCEYLVVPSSMDEVVLSSVFTKERRVKRIIG